MQIFEGILISSERTKQAAAVCFCTVHAFEKENSLKNLHCFVWLKSILFNLSCVFDLFVYFALLMVGENITENQKCAANRNVGISKETKVCWPQWLFSYTHANCGQRKDKTKEIYLGSFFDIDNTGFYQIQTKQGLLRRNQFEMYKK